MDWYKENKNRDSGFAVGSWMKIITRNLTSQNKLQKKKNVANELSHKEMFFKQPGNQPGCNSTKSTCISKIFYCQENVAVFTW